MSKSTSAADDQPDVAVINPPNVITVTMNSIPGYRIERVLGTVYGLTVRTRNIGATIGMGLKSLGGGELKWFTNMLYNARNDAVERMIGECLGRGGNALVAMRFETSELGGNTHFVQVAAYGTAVKVVKIEGDGLEARGGGVDA